MPAEVSSDDEAVAIFGGSFNPPHVAHLLAAAYVLSCGAVDRMVIVPCHSHPFGKALASFDDRLAMCRLAFADLRRSEVSDVESRLAAPSLTVRTLERLQTDHPGWRMRLVIGADVVHELDRWSEPDRIRALAPPLILGRLGASAHPHTRDVLAMLPHISSTQVRAAFAAGDDVDAIVPRAVVEHVRARGLYGAAAPYGSKRP